MRATLCLFLLAAFARANGFDALVDRFFDEYFQYHPSEATAAGFHQFDARLEDYSQSSIHAQIASLRKYETEFEHSAPSPDRDLMLSEIRGKLLDLENIRMWEKNPDKYSSGLANSVFVIMSRSFAPPEARLRSVIARERQAQALFAAARANLRNPPRIYTEVALEQLPGIIAFFRKDVPAAFQKVTDRGVLEEFHASNQGAIDALTGYQSFLERDLLPRSKGDFRIGAENYGRKLEYDEMVSIPLDRLLEIGFADLRRNQRALRETAAKIDPKRTPQQVLDELERDHPAAGSLLRTFRGVLSGLRAFITDHRILTIPSAEPPIVEETPPFDRALTFASMDTPGPFEDVAKEAFFNVTLPEPGWTRQRVEEHMAGFNRGTIISTAVHEVYPGHYTQFLWVKRAPSKVRKLVGAGSNSEGWAHYCEQMMLDEGYGQGDLKLRLGQLQDALLRNARYIAGIEMHTGKMTFEQSIRFFTEEGFQTRANAERETRRGTSDPTFLVYTLGKLEILKLRDDYGKKQGSRYSLLEFHDNFLKQGFPPVRLIRQAMLGDNSPVL